MSIETRNNVTCILLAVLALALFIAMGGDGVGESQRHGEWMRRLEEDGAWVLW